MTRTRESLRSEAGGWPSPLSASRVAAGGLRLSEPRLARDGIHWLEGRPAEGGRTALMRCGFDGETRELSGAIGDANARSRVHEYGGGAHCIRGDQTSEQSLFVDFATQRVRRPSGEFVTPAGASRADLVLSPDGAWLVCIEEEARPDSEPLNRVVAYALAGGERSVVAEGRDFYASPRFSPLGDRLVFLVWDHPDMPWDATQLWQVGWGRAGPAAPAQRIGDDRRESIVQPEFTPDGRLLAVTDRSGWWNLAFFDERGCTPAHEDAAEYAGPMWVFGLSHYALLDDATALCSVVRDGATELLDLDLRSGRSRPRPLPFEPGVVEGLRVADGRACFLAGGPRQPLSLFVLELASGTLRELRRSLEALPQGLRISVPRSMRFASANGREAHAFHYPPASAQAALAEGERPPLIVMSHGGPTAATHPVLDPRVQYWTSRGFAVVDVNYAGSTGYGRAYREALYGHWGVADVEDCVHAASTLAASGEADPGRMAITGGSAGGFTTLCALAFHAAFAAGASRYGIGDLELLVRDTHKFEARYTDRLVGPYPAARALYRERSPIHHLDGFRCPVLFLQGLEDRVVPPNQAETMANALAARGIPHALVTFEGEGHGFRSEASIRRALEAELAFYGEVFGFATDAPPGAIELRRSPA